MIGLDWPAHADRTPADERDSGRQFDVGWSRTQGELSKELERMGVDEWHIDTVSGSGSDPGVVLRWRDEHGPHVIADDQYSSKSANLRNLYLWVREQRKSSDRGVVTGSQDELAAAALPSGDDEDGETLSRPAHEVLGLPRDASESVIEARFKQLVKERHPDQGGSQHEYEELQAAREALLEDYPNAELSDRRRFNHVDDEKVFACPECDEARVRFRVLKRQRFGCNVCSAEFSEPVERESHNFSYSAGRVPDAPDEWLDSDPDEVEIK